MESLLTSKLAVDSGANPPLLFVHGIWEGAWSWDEHFLDAFAKSGYDAHAIDLTGHGASKEKVRFVSNGQYIKNIEAAVAG